MQYQKTEEMPKKAPVENKNFLYQREAGVWVYLIQAIVVMFFVFIGGLLIGWKFNNAVAPDWEAIFSNSLFAAWVGGISYFGYSLWRWSKLAWLENILGVNLDNDPRIGNRNAEGKRPTMYIRIVLPGGDERVADTGMPTENKRYLMAIARATVAGRPNSQQAMRRSGDRIPRPKHEKAMAAYVQLGVLRKENPEQANSRYVIAEPLNVNTAILQAVANGDFAMLKDVWESQNNQ